MTLGRSKYEKINNANTSPEDDAQDQPEETSDIKKVNFHTTSETITSAPIRFDQSTQTPPSLRKSNKSTTPVHTTYGSFVAYCFCVNYILGVGVLGVPYAFQKGGVIMGPIMLFIVTILAALVLVWILETLCRAVPFFKEREERSMRPLPSTSVVSLPELVENHEGVVRASVLSLESLDNQSTTSLSNNEVRLSTENPSNFGTESEVTIWQFPEKKYEINELCRMFLGIPGKIIYEVALALCLYGNLWGLTTVFAESMASNIPLPLDGWFTCNVYTDTSGTCDALYKIYVGVFALIVVPMTCLNLTEQKPVRKLSVKFSLSFDIRNYLDHL